MAQEINLGQEITEEGKAELMPGLGIFGERRWWRLRSGGGHREQIRTKGSVGWIKKEKRE
jgi:hypothetical protein